MRRWTAACAIGVTLALGAACTAHAPAAEGPATTTTIPPGYPDHPVGDDAIRLNQIQLVGTHNSYHISPDPDLIGLLLQLAQSFPQIAGPLGDPNELAYTHASIPQQLARGTRTFELDIYPDPDGGKFAQPRVLSLLNYSDPLLPAGLDVPGFKVLHIADLDYRTQCVSLDVCLGELRDWSDAHPGHLPILLDLELKSDGLPADLGGTVPIPWDSTQFDALDTALRADLGDRLLTPDDVRGAAPDLHTAITTTGWPTLAASRGKFLFYLDNEDLRDAYLVGHPSLQGRVLFTSSGEGQPDGAVLKVNEPGDGTEIHDLVSQGYLVRTRADESLLGDTARRDVALGSGAQIVSTDFPVGEPQAGTGYTTDLGLPTQGRCNPVTTTGATCQQAAVVEPQP
jgi:hypothetical protein